MQETVGQADRCTRQQALTVFDRQMQEGDSCREVAHEVEAGLQGDGVLVEVSAQ